MTAKKAKRKKGSRRERRPPRIQPRSRRAGRSDARVLVTLLVILALGGLLRGLYVTELTQAPDFRVPYSDAGYHDYWARGLAFGAWTPPPNEADPEIKTSPYLRPPAYPYFLALIYRITGGSYLAPRVVQACLGLLSVFLGFRLAASRIRPSVGLILAAFMAVYWAFIYFEGELHAVALLIPLLLLFTILVSGWSRRATLADGALAGVVLGLATITRPNAVVLLAAVGVWALWVRSRTRGRTRWGLAFLGLIVGTVLAILPTTIRNYAVSGEFVPITSNTGVNLYMGNNDEANGLCDGDLPGIGDFGTCFDYPAVLRTLERQLGRPLTSAQASNYLAGQAVRFVRENPGQALRLLGRKALLFWGPWEVTHNKVVALERETSGVLRRTPGDFPMVVALAGLGGVYLFVRWRRSRREGDGGSREAEAEWQFAGLVVLIVFAWFLSILPFFAAARYRTPVIPFLLLLGAVGVHGVYALFRRGQWLRAIGWSGLAVGLFALASVNVVGYRSEPAVWHYQRAMSSAAMGRTSEAIAGFRAALRADPDYWQAHLDLGVALALRGRNEEAAPHLFEAVRLNPTSPFTHYNVGLLFEVTGRLRESEEQYVETLRLDPGFPGVKDDLARVRRAIAESRSADELE
jgi:tetratricopeptide (TPR) repeat protein